MKTIDSIIFSFLLLSIVTVASCNGDKKSEEISSSNIKTDEPISAATPPIDAIKFRRLYITDDKLRHLDTIHKDVVFAFKIDAEGDIGMSGWIFKNGNGNNDFGGYTDFGLTKSTDTIIPYPNDLYLGTIILTKQTIRSITRALTSTDQYVIFTPIIKRSDSTVSYTISPSSLPKLVYSNTPLIKFSANPSPPKNTATN